MSTANEAMWDERFRLEGFAYGKAPSPYLVEKAPFLRPGMKALAAADGGGRNAVWLAQRGLDVTIIDFSAEGLRRATELAETRGVKIRTICADLVTYAWEPAVYDWVVAIYLHLPPAQRAIVHRRFAEILRPGGYLLIEGFHLDQLRYSSGGPRDPAMLFTETVLKDDFNDLEVLELYRLETELRESRLHWGPAVLTRLFARRPSEMKA